MAVAIRACAEEVEAMKESVRLCIVHPDAREGMKEAGGKGEHGKRFMRRRLSRAERDFVWEHSHRICYMCKVDLPRLSDWHVEHVIAFSKDPQATDVIGNMLAACSKCNLKKGKRSLCKCVETFAHDLDTRAQDASHLNTAARKILRYSLQIKRDLFTQCLSAEDPAVEILDELERAVFEDAAQAEQLFARYAGDVAVLEGVEIEDEDEGIGSGAFGEVFRGVWKGVAVAIKLPRTATKIDVRIFSREAQALGRLQHPNIVKHHGICVRQEGHRQSLGLVFDLCEFDMASRTVQKVANLPMLIAQTCDALSYMHQQHFLHRDVKPLNILVKLPPPANTKSPNKASISKQFRHAEARLADFGHSKNVEFFDFSSKATQGVGTRYFIAPESWGGIYSPLSDVYCLGMTMQWCRESDLNSLFCSRNDSLMQASSAAFKVWAAVESRCVSAQPEARPSAAEVALALRIVTGDAEIKDSKDAGGDAVSSRPGNEQKEAAEKVLGRRSELCVGKGKSAPASAVLRGGARGEAPASAGLRGGAGGKVVKDLATMIEALKMKKSDSDVGKNASNVDEEDDKDARQANDQEGNMDTKLWTDIDVRKLKDTTKGNMAKGLRMSKDDQECNKDARLLEELRVKKLNDAWALQNLGAGAKPKVGGWGIKEKRHGRKEGQQEPKDAGKGVKRCGQAAKEGGQRAEEEMQGAKEGGHGVKQGWQGVKEEGQGTKQEGQGAIEVEQGGKERGQDFKEEWTSEKACGGVQEFRHAEGWNVERGRVSSAQQYAGAGAPGKIRGGKKVGRDVEDLKDISDPGRGSDVMKLTVRQGLESKEDDDQQDDDETVFVVENARLRAGDKAGRRNMKYHMREGCCGAVRVAFLSEAEMCGHTPCSFAKCVKASNSTECKHAGLSSPRSAD